MSRLDDLVRSNPVPGWRGLAWIVILLLASAAAWAHFARLEEVATAFAKVVPQGQVKVIQHLEGGILRQIDVVEGQKVEAGDVLAALNLGATAMSGEELLVQIDGLTLRRSRLQAETASADVAFPTEIEKRRPVLARSERTTFDSRRRQLASAIEVLGRQRRQRELEVRELEAKRAAVRANLGLTRQRLVMSRGLMENKLVSRMEHLELKSEVISLEGKLAELKPAIPKVRAGIAEAAERMRQATLAFKRMASEELGQTELVLARIREQLVRASDQAKRTIIRSPIAGVVKNLRYHTIGGVVGADDPIMEIVPSEETLVIEAKLDPVDVGYVAVGQSATVKISTYDYIRYGGLDGRVTTIAPDANNDSTGRYYYKVIVRTDRAYLGDRPGAYPIIPGMLATVDIHTGDRSVLDFLFTPVLKLRHEAFRER